MICKDYKGLLHLAQSVKIIQPKWKIHSVLRKSYRKVDFLLFSAENVKIIKNAHLANLSVAAGIMLEGY